MNKTLKRILKFLLVNCILFITASFILIYWPIPQKKNIKNYDYSSIDTTSNKFLENAEEMWIKTRNGQALFSRIYHSETKTVCILIHGSGTESRYLADLSKSLADKNHALVITPDLRAHGRNFSNQTDIQYIGQLEDDIEDIIIYAKKKLSAEKIILAGHSSGGGLVLRYLGNNKLIQKIDKAIMIAPYLGHNSPTVKPNSGGWVTVAVKRWIGISMLHFFGIKMFNKMPVLFFNRPKAYNDHLQVASYSYQMAINFAPKNFDNDISNLKIKSLVIIGENDESFYPHRFTEVFKPVENLVKTTIIPNANHLDITKNDQTILEITNWIQE
ncbi:hypothetical protein APS56_08780 [Pseudalgibacter alginicilyticus]|uniref:Serine aminopeptidase S33 domain-containing protein n=1 Tax=Pseudalgibacter alginicilyticus TaxID=1736674 RepID=A0A0P0CL97_9FLAO|nr:alpha/beta hydrolase [Pseudalgibacter alginicilyticus]ALJ05211.1 hypothetical protein APS56_08780 [Pseudalgibacter alginicilyticus]